MDLTKASWRITEAATRDMVTDIEYAISEADAQNTILVAPTCWTTVSIWWTLLAVKRI
jgi:hypothetical protein